MQLKYRGVAYEYTPPAVDFVRSEVIGVGKYRGLDWRFCNRQPALVQQPTLDLVYRGATQAAPEAVAAAVPTGSSSQSLDLKARALMMKHGHDIKVRQQAMLERSAQEVGLDASVSSYWNRIQGKVHPTFRRTYDRSTATMS